MINTAIFPSSAQDICSTLHFELDLETGISNGPGGEGLMPGTVRHSDNMYALSLNRFGGRWDVTLVWCEPIGDEDDQEHHVVFNAEDQPDLAALGEAFQILADREVLTAAPR